MNLMQASKRSRQMQGKHELSDLADIISTYFKSSGGARTGLSSRINNFQTMDQSQQNEYLFRMMVGIGDDVRSLKEDIAWMRNLMRSTMQSQNTLVSDGTPDNYDMTPEQIKEMILEKIGLDKPFYPSDLATEYGLDFDAVLEAVEILRQEGRIVE